MRNLKIMLLFLFAAVAYSQAPAKPYSAHFVVFDGLLYRAKPDLTQFGLTPLTVVYSGVMWKKQSDQVHPPDADTVLKLATQASKSTGIAALDIECWPLNGDPSVVAASIQKYRQTLKLFKQAAPSLKVGYYGVAPMRDYYDSLAGRGSPKYKTWQAGNDLVSSIAKDEDVLFPSIYTFYKNNEDAWQKYAIEQMAEARRIAHGKPIYVFLWPQFHDATSDYLPPDYWRMELETARKYADGIVIWGGSQENWNPNAPWWIQTQQFLKENGISK